MFEPSTCLYTSRTHGWLPYSSNLDIDIYIHATRRHGLSACVGGVTVSMVAFQAVDPGSTLGRRTEIIF